MPETILQTEVYLVTRTYCENCGGSGVGGVTQKERFKCSSCKGEMFKETREILTETEAAQCKAIIDWELEKPFTRQ